MSHDDGRPEMVTPSTRRYLDPDHRTDDGFPLCGAVWGVVFSLPIWWLVLRQVWR